MVNKSNTVRQIADHIEKQIMTGTYVKGDRIQSIRSLAHELSVSPSSVYSAVTMLMGKGMLISETRIGYYVAVTTKAHG